MGLFFFGWDHMSRVKHLAVTWLMALATNPSALVLVANGWMRIPSARSSISDHAHGADQLWRC